MADSFTLRVEGQERRIQFSQARMEKMAHSTGTLIGSTIRGGVVAGGAIAGAGLTAALYQIVSAGLMFEKFETQLAGLEGSSAAGKRAMEWIKLFAAKTPYELQEVTEAFIALKAYGINPVDGTLRSLGDAAAGMGKSLMEAVEMIADAQTGEFERIKSFGIKASVEGDKVTFRWQRNGKEMSKTVRQSATEIRKALLGILDERLAGGMDRLSRITAGKWANLMDTLTTTSASIWQGGFGDEVNRQLDRLTGWVNGMAKDGSLKKWAEDTGRGLGDLVAAIGNTDWRAIGGGIRDVGGALMQLAAALRELDRWRSAISRFQSDAERMTGGGLLGGFANGHYVAPRWLPSGPKPAPDLPRRVPNSPLLRSEPRAPLQRPARQSPLLPGRAPVQWPTQSKTAPAAKGEIKLHVTTDKGVSVRPTKVAATNLDLEVNTGRAMGGFA